MSVEQVTEMLGIVTANMAEMGRFMKEVRDDLLEERREGGPGRVGGRTHGGRGERGGGSHEQLQGKAFEGFRKFRGGESEWSDWAADFRVLITTRSEQLSEVLEKVMDLGLTEKEVLDAKAVVWKTLEDKGEEQDPGHYDKYAEVGRLSRELYMWLRLTTEDEAKLIVKNVEDEDGVRAWGKLHAKYSQRRCRA